MNLNFC